MRGGFDVTQARQIVEKRKCPRRTYAVTGLYFLIKPPQDGALDGQAIGRGELEITTLLERFLHEDC